MKTMYWLVEFTATFSECFLCLIFCSTFINNDTYKNTPKKIITALTASGIMILINQIQLYSSLTVAFAFSLVMVMSAFVFEKNKLKASVLSVIFLLLQDVINNIFVSTISYATNISAYDIYQEMSLYRVIAIIASKIFLMIFTLVLNKIFARKRTLQVKYLLLLFVISTALLIISVLVTYIEIENGKVDSVICIMFFIIMLILLLFIFFGSFKLAEYYENLQALRMVQLKNAMLEESVNETKQSFELIQTNMHDYKHNIINLVSLAEKNDIQGIKKYLEKENELLGKGLFYYKTGNDTVDAMLYIKQKKAEKNGISFVINVNVPKNCPLSSQHLASILGNLLDNAIEASINEENPFIEIKINELAECFWIVISNSCKNPNVSLKTSKKDKHLHGFGINSVKRITKNYNGEIIINAENNKFEVRIMIPMQKTK